LISVEEAFAHFASLVPTPRPERVPLRAALGRVLLEAAVSTRTQPPFSASAMDGYAVRASEATPGACFRVIGEARAGFGFSGNVSPGTAVRIFTGAPIPNSADRVIIQEDVTRDGDAIVLSDTLDKSAHIRPAGGDFHQGDSVSAPRRLSARDIGLRP
jgi:molybdopterin molybdotransferase